MDPDTLELLLRMGIPADTLKGIPVDTMRTANAPDGGNQRIAQIASGPYGDTLLRALGATGLPTENVQVVTDGRPGAGLPVGAGGVGQRIAYVRRPDADTVYMDVNAPAFYSRQHPSHVTESSSERNLSNTLAHELRHLLQNHEAVQQFGSPEDLMKSEEKYRGTVADYMASVNRERDASIFASYMESLRDANAAKSSGQPMSRKEFEDLIMRRYERDMATYPGVDGTDIIMTPRRVRQRIRHLSDQMEGEFDLPEKQGMMARLAEGLGSLFGRNR